MAPSEPDRLLAHAFHKTSIARYHIGEMIHNFLTIARALYFLCHRESHRVGDSLAEWPGCCLDRIRQKILRVARSFSAQLAEIFKLFDRKIFIARQMEQAVKQH